MKAISIVCKKELKELLSPYGERRSSLLRVIALCAIFGLVIPLSQKDRLLENSLPALFFLAVPMAIVTGIVIDSFAGERERGTLETLLASRLPNNAILLGKVMAVIVYAWSITLISIFLSLIGINLATDTSELYLYSAFVLLVDLIGSLLIAGLMAGIGVFVSLKAKSVRSAQQTLSMTIFLFFFGLGFGLPALLEKMIPKDTVAGLQPLPPTMDPWAFAIIGFSALSVLDVAVLTWAVRQFKRGRLILE